MLRARSLSVVVKAGLAAVAVALLAAACVTSGGSTTFGGSAALGEVVADEPFYDPAGDEVLVDARLVATEPLAEFDTPDGPGEVVDGSLEPRGQLGDLQVATWRADDSSLGMVDCLGFTKGDGAGSNCNGDGLPTEGDVYFQITCPSGGEPEWVAFTIGETVTALRFELDEEQAVVGADPDGSGLVAVEATGPVSRVTAQTTAGEVRLVTAAAECPAE